MELPIQLNLFKLIREQTAAMFIDSKPRWTSSNEELARLWLRIAEEYFPNRCDLRDYKVIWSPRSQKRVLGSCNLTDKRVRVARALDNPAFRELLEALLYHEMCHAVVGMKKGRKGRRVFHGREFRELERAHPFSRRLDLWIKEGGWRAAVRSYASHRGRSLSINKSTRK